MCHCERFYGAGWYFAPTRWPTVDGYAPAAVVWVAWRAMQSITAAERLSLTRAIGLAVAKDPTAHAREYAIAYPSEN